MWQYILNLLLVGNALFVNACSNGCRDEELTSAEDTYNNFVDIADNYEAIDSSMDMRYINDEYYDGSDIASDFDVDFDEVEDDTAVSDYAFARRNTPKNRNRNHRRSRLQRRHGVNRRGKGKNRNRNRRNRRYPGRGKNKHNRKRAIVVNTEDMNVDDGGEDVGYDSGEDEDEDDMDGEWNTVGYGDSDDGWQYMDEEMYNDGDEYGYTYAAGWWANTPCDNQRGYIRTKCNQIICKKSDDKCVKRCIKELTKDLIA